METGGSEDGPCDRTGENMYQKNRGFLLFCFPEKILTACPSQATKMLLDPLCCSTCTENYDT